MGDVLNLLRDYVQKDRLPKEMNDKIYLGSRSFERNLETSFPIKRSKKHKVKGNRRKFYNLGEVLFFLQNRSLPHQQYVKKAQESNIMNVWQVDRKPLLARICGNTALKSTVKKDKSTSNKTSEHSAPDESSSYPEADHGSNKPRLEKTSNGNGREKPQVRTYSRKRCGHGLRTSSRRLSQDSEDQSATFTDSATQDSNSDELVSTGNENENLEMSVKSMTTFLKDYLGLNAHQLKVLQDGVSNPDELGNIAADVKSNIVQESMLLCSDTASQLNLKASKYCYKAIKHPIRGWEMMKEELSSVLSGLEAHEQHMEVGDHDSAAIEDCIEKGSVHLKRAFSVLISQMREFNIPQKSLEESETFCQKIIEDCLKNAVDSFRDIFSLLLSSQRDGDQADTVEKWLNVSKAELGKLFQSLAKTLQSLRDIPSNHKNPPLTLFHLPEPTFSLALNPAKVTHSVVLEMYFRIGLAELRQIVMHLMGFGPPSSNAIFTINCSNSSTNNCHCKGNVPELSQENANLIPLHEETLKFREMHDPSPQTSSFQSPEYISASEYQEALTKQENQCAETSTSNHPLFKRVLLCSNVGARRSVPRNSPYQARRSSESDYIQYSVFKASLGSTLVSSFKKQIQEKIQASDSVSQW